MGVEGCAQRHGPSLRLRGRARGRAAGEGSGTSNPVGSGFVDSLARPGGNATGFTNWEFLFSLATVPRGHPQRHQPRQVCP
jgi:hypothetical protein